jgi:hypothetical protein
MLSGATRTESTAFEFGHHSVGDILRITKLAPAFRSSSINIRMLEGPSNIFRHYLYPNNCLMDAKILMLFELRQENL